LKAILAAALMFSAMPAFAGDVSVSIGVNQPGFYGQITLGDYPRPAVIYAQPMIIERVPGYVEAEPLYLHVPPGHEKHWRQHCGEYHACGRRVFFVQDQWYRNDYVRRSERRDDRHDERRDDRRYDDAREHDRGRGHGHDEARRDDHRDKHGDKRGDERRDDRDH